MKRKKDKPKYMWVHMTDEEIFAYAPVFYNTRRDALDALHDDIGKIAKKNHYKVDDVMVLSVKALEDKVNEMWMWGRWTDANEETEI